MKKQEIINYLRDLSDWIEERSFGDKDVEYLRKIADELHKNYIKIEGKEND